MASFAPSTASTATDSNIRNSRFSFDSPSVTKDERGNYYSSFGVSRVKEWTQFVSRASGGSITGINFIGGSGLDTDAFLRQKNSSLYLSSHELTRAENERTTAAYSNARLLPQRDFVHSKVYYAKQQDGTEVARIDTAPLGTKNLLGFLKSGPMGLGRTDLFYQTTKQDVVKEIKDYISDIKGGGSGQSGKYLKVAGGGGKDGIYPAILEDVRNSTGAIYIQAASGKASGDTNLELLLDELKIQARRGRRVVISVGSRNKDSRDLVQGLEEAGVEIRDNSKLPGSDWLPGWLSNIIPQTNEHANLYVIKGVGGEDISYLGSKRITPDVGGLETMLRLSSKDDTRAVKAFENFFKTRYDRVITRQFNGIENRMRQQGLLGLYKISGPANAPGRVAVSGELATTGTQPFYPTVLPDEFFKEFNGEAIPQFQIYSGLYSSRTGEENVPDAIKALDRAISTPSFGRQINRTLGFEYYQSGQGFFGSTLTSLGRGIDYVFGMNQFKEDEEERQGKHVGTLRKMLNLQYGGKENAGTFESLMGVAAALPQGIATALGFYFAVNLPLRHVQAYLQQETISSSLRPRGGIAPGNWMQRSVQKLENFALKVTFGPTYGEAIRQATATATTVEEVSQNLFKVLKTPDQKLLALMQTFRTGGATDTERAAHLARVAASGTLQLGDELSLFGLSRQVRKYEGQVFNNLLRPVLESISPYKYGSLAHETFQSTLDDLYKLAVADPELVFYDSTENKLLSNIKFNNLGPQRIQAAARAFDRLGALMPVNLAYWVPGIREAFKLPQFDPARHLTFRDIFSFEEASKGVMDFYTSFSRTVFNPTELVPNTAARIKGELSGAQYVQAWKDKIFTFPQAARESLQLWRNQIQQSKLVSKLRATAPGAIALNPVASGTTLEQLTALYRNQTQNYLRAASELDAFMATAAYGQNQTVSAAQEKLYSAYSTNRLNAGEWKPATHPFLDPNDPKLHQLAKQPNTAAYNRVQNLKKGLKIAGFVLIADVLADNMLLSGGSNLVQQLFARKQLETEKGTAARFTFTGVAPGAFTLFTASAAGVTAGLLMPEFVDRGSLLPKQLINQIDYEAAVVKIQQAASGGHLPFLKTELDDLLAAQTRYVQAAQQVRPLKTLRFNKGAAATAALITAFGVKLAFNAVAAASNWLYNRNGGYELDPTSGLLSATLERMVTKKQSTMQTVRDASDVATGALLAQTNLVTKPDGTEVYSVASQITSPFFQITNLLKISPQDGTAQFSVGFQLAPILGLGMTPTLPFALRLKQPVRTQEETSLALRRYLNNLSPLESAQYYGQAAVGALTFGSNLAYDKDSPFVSAGQFLGASALVGTGASLASPFLKRAFHRLPASSQSYLVEAANDTKALRNSARGAYSLVSGASTNMLSLPIVTARAVGRGIGSVFGKATGPIALVALGYAAAEGVVGDSLPSWQGSALKIATIGTVAFATLKGGKYLPKVQAGGALRTLAPFYLAMTLLNTMAAPDATGSGKDFNDPMYRAQGVLGAGLGLGYLLHSSGAFATTRELSDSFLAKTSGHERKALLTKVFPQVSSTNTAAAAEMDEILEAAAKLQPTAGRGGRRFLFSNNHQLTRAAATEIWERSQASLNASRAATGTPKPIRNLAGKEFIGTGGRVRMAMSAMAVAFVGANLIASLIPESALSAIYKVPFIGPTLQLLSGVEARTPVERLFDRSSYNRPEGAVGFASTLSKALTFGYLDLPKILGMYKDKPDPYLSLLGPFGQTFRPTGTGNYFQFASSFSDLSFSGYQIASRFRTDIAKNARLYKGGVPKDLSAMLRRIRGSAPRKQQIRMGQWLTSYAMQAAEGGLTSRAIQVQNFYLQHMSWQTTEQLMMDMYREGISTGAISSSALPHYRNRRIYDPMSGLQSGTFLWRQGDRTTPSGSTMQTVEQWVEQKTWQGRTLGGFSAGDLIAGFNSQPSISWLTTPLTLFALGGIGLSALQIGSSVLAAVGQKDVDAELVKASKLFQGKSLLDPKAYDFVSHLREGVGGREKLILQVNLGRLNGSGNRLGIDLDDLKSRLVVDEIGAAKIVKGGYRRYVQTTNRFFRTTYANEVSSLISSTEDAATASAQFKSNVLTSARERLRSVLVSEIKAGSGVSVYESFHGKTPNLAADVDKLLDELIDGQNGGLLSQATDDVIAARSSSRYNRLTPVRQQAFLLSSLENSAAFKQLLARVREPIIGTYTPQAARSIGSRITSRISRIGAVRSATSAADTSAYNEAVARLEGAKPYSQGLVSSTINVIKGAGRVTTDYLNYYKTGYEVVEGLGLALDSSKSNYARMVGAKQAVAGGLTIATTFLVFGALAATGLPVLATLALGVGGIFALDKLKQSFAWLPRAEEKVVSSLANLIVRPVETIARLFDRVGLGAPARAIGNVLTAPFNFLMQAPARLLNAFTGNITAPILSSLRIKETDSLPVQTLKSFFVPRTAYDLVLDPWRQQLQRQYANFARIAEVGRNPDDTFVHPLLLGRSSGPLEDRFSDAYFQSPGGSRILQAFGAHNYRVSNTLLFALKYNQAQFDQEVTGSALKRMHPQERKEGIGGYVKRAGLVALAATAFQAIGDLRSGKGWREVARGLVDRQGLNLAVSLATGWSPPVQLLATFNSERLVDTGIGWHNRFTGKHAEAKRLINKVLGPTGTADINFRTTGGSEIGGTFTPGNTAGEKGTLTLTNRTLSDLKTPGYEGLRAKFVVLHEAAHAKGFSRDYWKGLNNNGFSKLGVDKATLRRTMTAMSQQSTIKFAADRAKEGIQLSRNQLNTIFHEEMAANVRALDNMLDEADDMSLRSFGQSLSADINTADVRSQYRQLMRGASSGDGPEGGLTGARYSSAGGTSGTGEFAAMRARSAQLYKETLNLIEAPKELKQQLKNARMRLQYSKLYFKRAQALGISDVSMGTKFYQGLKRFQKYGPEGSLLITTEAKYRESQLHRIKNLLESNVLAVDRSIARNKAIAEVTNLGEVVEKVIGTRDIGQIENEVTKEWHAAGKKINLTQIKDEAHAIYLERMREYDQRLDILTRKFLYESNNRGARNQGKIKQFFVKTLVSSDITSANLKIFLRKLPLYPIAAIRSTIPYAQYAGSKIYQAGEYILRPLNKLLAKVNLDVPKVLSGAFLAIDTVMGQKNINDFKDFNTEHLNSIHSGSAVDKEDRRKKLLALNRGVLGNVAGNVFGNGLQYFYRNPLIGLGGGLISTALGFTGFFGLADKMTDDQMKRLEEGNAAYAPIQSTSFYLRTQRDSTVVKEMTASASDLALQAVAPTVKRIAKKTLKGLGQAWNLLLKPIDVLIDLGVLGFNFGVSLLGAAATGAYQLASFVAKAVSTLGRAAWSGISAAGRTARSVATTAGRGLLKLTSGFSNWAGKLLASPRQFLTNLLTSSKIVDLGKAIAKRPDAAVASLAGTFLLGGAITADLTGTSTSRRPPIRKQRIGANGQVEYYYETQSDISTEEAERRKSTLNKLMRVAGAFTLFSYSALRYALDPKQFTWKQQRENIVGLFKSISTKVQPWLTSTTSRFQQGWLQLRQSIKDSIDTKVSNIQTLWRKKTLRLRRQTRVFWGRRVQQLDGLIKAVQLPALNLLNQARSGIVTAAMTVASWPLALVTQIGRGVSALSTSASNLVRGWNQELHHKLTRFSRRARRLTYVYLGRRAQEADEFFKAGKFFLEQFVGQTWRDVSGSAEEWLTQTVPHALRKSWRRTRRINKVYWGRQIQKFGNSITDFKGFLSDVNVDVREFSKLFKDEFKRLVTQDIAPALRKSWRRTKRLNKVYWGRKSQQLTNFAAGTAQFLGYVGSGVRDFSQLFNQQFIQPLSKDITTTLQKSWRRTKRLNQVYWGRKFKSVSNFLAGTRDVLGSIGRGLWEFSQLFNEQFIQPLSQDITTTLQKSWRRTKRLNQVYWGRKFKSIGNFLTDSRDVLGSVGRGILEFSQLFNDQFIQPLSKDITRTLQKSWRRTKRLNQVYWGRKFRSIGNSLSDAGDFLADVGVDVRQFSKLFKNEFDRLLTQDLPRAWRRSRRMSQVFLGRQRMRFSRYQSAIATFTKSFASGLRNFRMDVGAEFQTWKTILGVWAPEIQTKLKNIRPNQIWKGLQNFGRDIGAEFQTWKTVAGVWGSEIATNLKNFGGRASQSLRNFRLNIGAEFQTWKIVAGVWGQDISTNLKTLGAGAKQGLRNFGMDLASEFQTWKTIGGIWGQDIGTNLQALGKGAMRGLQNFRMDAVAEFQTWKTVAGVWGREGLSGIKGIGSGIWNRVSKTASAIARPFKWVGRKFKQVATAVETAALKLTNFFSPNVGRHLARVGLKEAFINVAGPAFDLATFASGTKRMLELNDQSSLADVQTAYVEAHAGRYSLVGSIFGKVGLGDLGEAAFSIGGGFLGQRHAEELARLRYEAKDYGIAATVRDEIQPLTREAALAYVGAKAVERHLVNPAGARILNSAQKQVQLANLLKSNPQAQMQLMQRGMSAAQIQRLSRASWWSSAVVAMAKGATRAKQELLEETNKRLGRIAQPLVQNADQLFKFKGFLGKGAQLLGKVAEPVIDVGFMAYGAHQMMTSKSAAQTESGSRYFTSGAFALAGATIGGLFGGPAGAIVGSIVGSMAGDWVGGKLARVAEKHNVSGKQLAIGQIGGAVGGLAVGALAALGLFALGVASLPVLATVAIGAGVIGLVAGGYAAAKNWFGGKNKNKIEAAQNRVEVTREYATVKPIAKDSRIAKDLETLKKQSSGGEADKPWYQRFWQGASNLARSAWQRTTSFVKSAAAATASFFGRAAKKAAEFVLGEAAHAAEPTGGLPDFSGGDVSGSYKPNVNKEFLAKTVAIAKRLNTRPEYLLAVMGFESGGTYSPAQPNKAGSGAMGLIQFMPETARGLGTSTAALARMSRVQQLDYVEKYFKGFKGSLGSVEQVYAAVLAGKKVSGPDSVLFMRGTKEYAANATLDKDRDGRMTAREAAEFVRPYLPDQSVLADVPGFKAAEVVGETSGGAGVGKIGSYFVRTPRGGTVKTAEDLSPHWAGTGGYTRYRRDSHNKHGQVSYMNTDSNQLVYDFTIFQKGSSAVPVPSPLAGRVITSGGKSGTVRVKAANGEVITIHHLYNIPVKVGQTVRYGQSLGIQGAVGLRDKTAIHVHLEATRATLSRYIKALNTGDFGSTTSAQKVASTADPDKLRQDLHGANPTAAARGKTYIRVERSGVKDKYGLEMLNVMLVDAKGKVIDNLLATSGRPNKQNFLGAGQTRSGSKMPLEAGTYKLGAQLWAQPGNWSRNQSATLGPASVQLLPKFRSDRSAIVIHTDFDRASAPGTEGCLGLLEVEHMKKVIGWLGRKDAPTELVADWKAPKKLTVVNSSSASSGKSTTVSVSGSKPNALNRLLHIIAYGESRFNSNAGNGQYKGAFQFGTSTRRAALNRTGKDAWGPSLQKQAEAAAAWIKSEHPAAWAAINQGNLDKAFYLLGQKRLEWPSLPGGSQSHWEDNRQNQKELSKFKSGNFQPKFNVTGGNPKAATKRDKNDRAALPQERQAASLPAPQQVAMAVPVATAQPNYSSAGITVDQFIKAYEQIKQAAEQKLAELREKNKARAPVQVAVAQQTRHENADTITRSPKQVAAKAVVRKENGKQVIEVSKPGALVEHNWTHLVGYVRSGEYPDMDTSQAAAVV